MIKILLLTALFISGQISFVQAQTSSMMQEAFEAGKLLGEQAKNKEISEDMRKSAEAAFDTIFNGQVSKNVEQYKNSMTFDPETGIVKFSQTPKLADNNIKAAENGVFNSDERIYIFISSSMPSEVLNNYKNYIKAKNIGDTVSFVIRGCLPQGGGFNGCKDFIPTINFAKSMVIADDNKTGVTGLLIDPVLFKTYGVTNVPQVVYAKNVNRRVDLGSEGDFSRLDSTPQWWKSVGDWSMDYHLQELYDLSKEEKLKKLFDSDIK